jgi:uncharacterized membrane protein YphA (DoxX/SURF4 family)
MRQPHACIARRVVGDAVDLPLSTERSPSGPNQSEGDAKNMKEEFAVYGLPAWSVGVVGFLKILLAALLIAGIWLPAVTKPAAIGMAVLMLGAVSMHIKVKDPLQRSLVLVAVL